VNTGFVKLERAFFRRLNSLVEPAVRRGVASSRLTPASLIVLETTGFKSGMQRRTPLWSFRLGRYRVVSTARGDRSLWIRNLQQEPLGSYYLGGKQRRAEALVISADAPRVPPSVLPPVLARISDFLARFTDRGWAFAVLVPA
jgi:deazaflavin-dependent oxidoreductase (nitroreductase family)